MFSLNTTNFWQWDTKGRRTIKFDSDSFYLSKCCYDAWYIKDMMWHRINGPAVIEYRMDGSISLVSWYYQDRERRLGGGPTEIDYGN